MKHLYIAAVLASLISGAVLAAEKSTSSPDSAWVAAKSAEIETMRVRLGTSPSTNATSTLIEVEDLLRRFKTAPADQKNSLRSQVDAAVARLELETTSNGR